MTLQFTAIEIKDLQNSFHKETGQYLTQTDIFELQDFDQRFKEYAGQNLANLNDTGKGKGRRIVIIKKMQQEGYLIPNAMTEAIKKYEAKQK